MLLGCCLESITFYIKQLLNWLEEFPTHSLKANSDIPTKCVREESENQDILEFQLIQQNHFEDLPTFKSIVDDQVY